MNILQIIVVLCVVVLVPVAYYFGTQTTPEPTIENTETATEEIEPPTRTVDTAPDDTPTVTLPTGKTIDLSSQGLIKVPEYVFSEKDTIVLDVSNNKLEGALQAEVRHLENLKVLDLSNNNFTGVPAEIGRLSKLEQLNLSGNPLTGLPYELGNLNNLKVLDLRNTNYSEQDLAVISQNLPSSVTILK